MSRSAAGQYYGDFVPWNGGCLLIGEGQGSIAPHAHYSIQIAFGFPSGLRVQVGQGHWMPCGAAIIPSRAIHSIDTNDCEWGGVLFVEPETPEGRALGMRLNGEAELLSAPDSSALTGKLERAWRIRHDRPLVESACREFVGELTNTVARNPSDPRVLAAIDYIRQRIDTPISLPAVAKVAHLSPGRFRHLFVEETGMPLRTYVLWRRLLKVWTLLMQGRNLSEAAHAVGFADSAHLSRTSRTMFGTTPSALQMSGPLSRLERKVPY
jgi:AraC-like DNA-binding protein